MKVERRQFFSVITGGLAALYGVPLLAKPQPELTKEIIYQAMNNLVKSGEYERACIRANTVYVSNEVWKDLMCDEG